MGTSDPRAALDALVTASGESYAALSRLLGRNAAYLQQFVRRGSPRRLAERDRRVLAAYFGVDEAALGAPASSAGRAAMVAVPRIDAAASAGPGALVEEDREGGVARLDPALLRRLGVRAADVSLILAQGESMLPTIADGDELLVDTRDRRVGARGGVFVIRLDGVLMVKRLSQRAGGLVVGSDNPAFPALDGTSAEVVGRVVWLSRNL